MLEKTPRKRHAALFIDRKGETGVVVSLHYHGKGGFLFEDDAPAVIAVADSSERLGAALLRALSLSEVRPTTSHHSWKPSDWPAFRASGRKTVKQFESEFIRLHVSGANEANIIYSIEGWPERDAKLSVVAAANAHSANELGERCMLVWRACRDRVI